MCSWRISAIFLGCQEIQMTDVLSSVEVNCTYGIVCTLFLRPSTSLAKKVQRHLMCRTRPQFSKLPRSRVFRLQYFKDTPLLAASLSPLAPLPLELSAFTPPLSPRPTPFSSNYDSASLPAQQFRIAIERLGDNEDKHESLFSLSHSPKSPLSLRQSLLSLR